MSASLDERKVLEQLAGFVVAGVGDWCGVDLIDEDGVPERVVLAHADPTFEEAAAHLRTLTPSTEPDAPLRKAIDTRRTQLLPEIPDELLQQAARNEAELAMLRSLRITAGMIVPMLARGKLIGALSIAWTDEGREVSPTDIVFVEELARRGSIAVDNARLLAAVRATDERYRSLVDQLDAVVWELDMTDGSLVYVSPSVERILGFRPDDSRLAAMLVPEGLGLGNLATLLRHSDDHTDLEFPVRAEDGRTVWLLGRFYRDAAGPVQTVRALAVDISERKERERQIRTELAVARVFSEEEDPERIPPRVMRALLSEMGWDAAGMWTVDAAGVLRCDAFETLESGAFADFAAVSSEIAMAPGVGLPGRVREARSPAWIEDVTVDPNFPRAPAARAAGLRTAFGFPIEVAGTVTVVIEMFTRHRRPRDERLLAAMGSIAAQIGQFVERRRWLRSLRESEGLLRAVVDASLDSIIAMDAAGRVIELNPAAEATFGYQRDEAIGRPMAELIIPPEFRSQHLRAVERHLATGRSTLIGKRLRLTGLRADGSRFPVELTIARVGTTDPVFVGSVRDMTRWDEQERRREAQLAVSRALAESESLDELGTRILSSIAQPLGWQAGALWLADHGVEHLTCAATWTQPGYDPASFAHLTTGRTFEPGEGLLGLAWQDERPAWVEDVTHSASYLRAEEAAAAGVRSMIVFPVGRGGTAHGVVEFYTVEKVQEDDALLDTLGAFGRQIAGAIDRLIAARELSMNRAILASLSDASIEGVVVVATDGSILTRNARFDEMFGTGDPEAPAEQVLDTVLGALADRAQGEAGFTEAFNDPGLSRRRDFALADGRFVEIYTVPLSSGIGAEPFARAWYFRDVTERKRTERILRESTERAALLAEVGGVLMRSLDVREMLGAFLRRVVPALGTGCHVDLLADEGMPAVSVGQPSRPDVPALSRTEDSGRAASARDLATVWRARSGAASSPGAPRAGVPGRDDAGYVCTPLRPRGRLLGVMTVLVDDPARDVDRTLVSLVEDVAWRLAAALDNAMLHAERSEIARTLQESLLPPELPAIPGVSLAARYRAGRAGLQIGGDFYDVFEAARGDWALVMGDVSGKGAEAASLTALARYTIRASVMRTRRPQHVLGQLNQAIVRELGDERFATAAYIRLRRPPTGWRITVASAGHPLPLLVRPSGEVKALGSPGSLLGVFPDVSIREEQGRVEPGDTIVLYTDGITEARTEGRLFGVEALAEVLRATAVERPTAMVAAVIDALDAHGGGTTDDLAILAARIEHDPDPQEASEGA